MGKDRKQRLGPLAYSYSELTSENPCYDSLDWEVNPCKAITTKDNTNTNTYRWQKWDSKPWLQCLGR